MTNGHNIISWHQFLVLNLSRVVTNMSLAISYSSDEEENITSAAKDAFALSALPVAKKTRVEETSTSTDAAPHVLSEVGHF